MSGAPELGRSERLDALRGAAIVWMAAFHLCFDLNMYGLIAAQNFYRDPFWTGQRTVIVSLFLFTAGLAQALALQRVGDASRFTPPFWRRWAQVAGCALLVSIGSAMMFPKSWISFGVLHGIAVMLILLRAMSRWPVLSLWLLGGVAMALPRWVQHAWFDLPYSNWIGLVTRKPVTEDWVPVLPWLGVMLWGLAAGRWLLQHRGALLAGPLARPLAPLALLGRWPLTFYMLHQPVFIGLILGGRALQVW